MQVIQFQPNRRSRNGAVSRGLASVASAAGLVFGAIAAARRASANEHLFRMSEAELAARGLTHQDLFDRVFGPK